MKSLYLWWPEAPDIHHPLRICPGRHGRPLGPLGGELRVEVVPRQGEYVVADRLLLVLEVRHTVGGDHPHVVALVKAPHEGPRRGALWPT